MSFACRCRLVPLFLVLLGCSGTSPTAAPGGGAYAEKHKEFFQAVEEGKVGRIVQLLKEGVGVDDKDAEGRTALVRAAAAGQLAVAEVLVEHKAILAVADRDGRTPLMLAARGGHTATVALLKARHSEKVQPDTFAQHAALRDKDGRTALMHAAVGGHADIVASLIYHLDREDATSPAWRDGQGKTALMLAAEGGHKGTVAVMLGELFPGGPLTAAYITAKDNGGKTARELAEEKGHKEVAALIAAREK